MDWNAAKSACHLAVIIFDDDCRGTAALRAAFPKAVIDGMMLPMQSWEDDRRDELAGQFPGWDVWYVHHAGQRRNTWCARPKGAPVAVFHAWDSAELGDKIRRAEAEAGKP